MVYHYTNFIYETNFWWMRRVRPVWMTIAFGIGVFIFQRYYFFGKNSVIQQNKQPTQVWERRAQQNKRNWGFNAVYKPTLERSRKKAILQALGDKYDYPIAYADRNTFSNKSIEQILEEENDY